MKHIFIINPAAGIENAYEKIKNAVNVCQEKIEHEFYETKAPMDATRYIKEYCANHSEPVRFYACGGDGTLNEVANGVQGFDNAELAVIPTGSGNDFVKYYGDKKEFLDIKNNIEGTAEKIDLLKIGDRYSINVINFGFDSMVANTMQKVRRKKIIGGKRAYPTGVVRALFGGMKNKCFVNADGKQLNQDDMLLCTVSNGCYVGGSYKCAPRAVNNDGLAEICLFRTISWFTFLRLMNTYKAGKQLDDPRFKDYLTYCRAKKIECISKEKKFAISVDGEIIYSNRFTIEVVPKAIKFVIPKTLCKAPATV